MGNFRLLITVMAVCLVQATIVACGNGGKPSSGEEKTATIDSLNATAYAEHYRSLDRTRQLADSAFRLSAHHGYSDGQAEALNNLAFVALAKMDYDRAQKQLGEISHLTDNQLELLVADVQMMRLCQRRSKNKEFYEYLELAKRRMQRIGEDLGQLTRRQQARLTYAESEYHIVASTYLYYVGLAQQSQDILLSLDSMENLQTDTAQTLSYWYNIGAGGIVTGGTPEERNQTEFNYLMRCYQAARSHHFPYWEAQALQGLSTHLENSKEGAILFRDNPAAITYINVNLMPDSLLAGNLAEQALGLFQSYGDVYQIAGAYRTLAENYWQIGDYPSAVAYLDSALSPRRVIDQAPDLVASICEQMSLAYSALNDKPSSDHYRNIYLDLQEQTRQDRQLEARATQLDASASQLNIMLTLVVAAIFLLIAMLVLFAYLRRRNDKQFPLSSLLEPLGRWQEENEKRMQEAAERKEELEEQTNVATLHLEQNKEANLEQRAKIQLVNSILPLIDRMVAEAARIKRGGESAEVEEQRYQYITELADTINKYNDVLTQWIQMKRGQVSLRIENFPLQPLLDVISHSRTGFQMKGVRLVVEKSDAIVKADRTLTLFMLNTIADNARKFTPRGGEVRVSAKEEGDSVELAVTDTGCGMDEAARAKVFDRAYTGGHGFGLRNCAGIIEQYKKVSSLFKVCAIDIESHVGKGTRVFFRLPKGVRRTLAMLVALLTITCPATARASRLNSNISQAFADSAYYSNINGTFEKTLQWADSCHKYLEPGDTLTLLDISNETAVAALALHKWDVYQENNEVYTRLFRLKSADSTLPQYVRAMQQSESNKTVAIILLVLLLIAIVPAYYFLYYRRRMGYRACIERIRRINQLLLSGKADQEKLDGVLRLADLGKFHLTPEANERLSDIVERIANALRDSIADSSRQQASLELAHDNLRRLQLDNDKLHVSNSILDNCLSTLKHETMFYPSRISQLVAAPQRDIDALAEVAAYYRRLYALLSEQAARQIAPTRFDPYMTTLLMATLKRINGYKPVETTVEQQGAYTRVSLEVRNEKFKVESSIIFTPVTPNLKFLLCKQIVREMGEVTNLRACGISAIADGQGTVALTITLPTKYYEGI